MLNNCDKVDDVTTPYKYDSFKCYRLFAMLNYVYVQHVLNWMFEVSLTYV